MASTNKTSLPPRRRPGSWCLWTLVIPDTRPPCAPSTKANSRFVKHVEITDHLLSRLTNSPSGITTSLRSAVSVPCLLRSLLQPVTQSWEARTLTRSSSSISAKSLPKSTSWMWGPSPGLWSGSTRSVRNWRGWWALTPPICRWTSSVSWMTSMSLERWTGGPTVYIQPNVFLSFKTFVDSSIWNCHSNGHKTYTKQHKRVCWSLTLWLVWSYCFNAKIH